jgi:hypothetical protein
MTCSSALDRRAEKDRDCAALRSVHSRSGIDRLTVMPARQAKRTPAHQRLPLAEATLPRLGQREHEARWVS